MLTESAFLPNGESLSQGLRSNVANFRRPSTSFVPRCRALFWEGEEDAQKIEIVEGVVRAVRLLENGNRQILAFYWPGEVVMPTHSTHQQFTAEAVTDCRVIRSRTSGVCRSDEPCGAHQVLAETLTLVMTMSQKNCVARIACRSRRTRIRSDAFPASAHISARRRYRPVRST